MSYFFSWYLAKIVFDLLIIRFYEINIPFAGYFLHEVWGLRIDCQDFPTERSLLGVVAEGAFITAFLAFSAQRRK